MAEKPNFLLIVCDSARADAYTRVGADGSGDLDWVRTPTADRLAREGLTFTRAFTPIGICHPARACLDTGLYAHANGQLANSVWDKPNLYGIRPEVPSYLSLLQTVGYRVGYTGQRHLRQSLFDDVVPGAITGFKQAGLRETARQDRPRSRFFGELDLPAGQHRDDFTKRGAIELLRRYAGQDRPWLIQCEFDGPHPPFVLPREFATLYDPAQIPKPRSFDDLGEEKPSHHRRERAAQMPEPWGDQWRQLIAHYGGYVTMLDQFTGKILEELDRLGMGNDTVVIFTSDHGELVGAHGAVTKYPQMYDEVLRVPLRVRWSGHTPPGAVEDSFVSHLDILPTLTDLAGAPQPENRHGSSWAARARGKSDLETPRDTLMAQLHGWGSNAWCSLRMVRSDRWKYVWSPFIDDELYDLVTDPGERQNLASTQPEQVRTMRVALGNEMQAVSDPLAGHRDLAVE